MREALLKKTARFAAIYGIIALTVCFWRAATKPVILSGTVQARETVKEQAQQEAEEASEPQVLALTDPAPGADCDLEIPLPMGMSSEDVESTNHYLPRQLRITLCTRKGNFEKGEEQILARSDKVREAVYVRMNREEVSLRFALTGLYEPESSLSEGALHIRLCPPGELYDRVILVDPVRPASGEDITLDVAEAFAELYSSSVNTRVYLTRMDEAHSEETVRALLTETEPDLCIRLCTGGLPAGEEETAAGTAGLRAGYNDTWFLRKYDNASFADALAAGMQETSGIRVTDIRPVGLNDPLLAASQVPAAILSLGDPADSADAAFLTGEDTAAELAKGMSEAVKEAFAALEE